MLCWLQEIRGHSSSPLGVGAAPHMRTITGLLSLPLLSLPESREVHVLLYPVTYGKVAVHILGNKKKKKVS
jgi:hypothetical protein